MTYCYAPYQDSGHFSQHLCGKRKGHPGSHDCSHYTWENIVDPESPTDPNVTDTLPPANPGATHGTVTLEQLNNPELPGDLVVEATPIYRDDNTGNRGFTARDAFTRKISVYQIGERVSFFGPDGEVIVFDRVQWDEIVQAMS